MRPAARHRRVVDFLHFQKQLPDLNTDCGVGFGRSYNVIIAYSELNTFPSPLLQRHIGCLVGEGAGDW